MLTSVSISLRTTALCQQKLTYAANRKSFRTDIMVMVNWNANRA